MTDLLDKWITPTTLIAIFGGIVWGIQLNFIVLEHTKEIASIQRESDILDTMSQTNADSIIRLTAIIDELERRIQSNSKHREQHEKEADDWKRTIIQNESRIKSLESR